MYEKVDAIKLSMMDDIMSIRSDLVGVCAMNCIDFGDVNIIIRPTEITIHVGKEMYCLNESYYGGEENA